MDLCHIHNIFVTHEHTDHIMGIVWMVRMVAAAMKRGSMKANCRFTATRGLVDTISTICRLTIQGKFYKMIGSRIFLVPVEDGETVHILDYDVTFFDILSTKARQFGFTTILKNGRRFTCAGDEPYNAECRPYVEGSDWLLHEAFCLYRDRDIFEPYEKHHSTVKKPASWQRSSPSPTLCYGIRRTNTWRSAKPYIRLRAGEYYDGNLLVPDDGEIIPL